MQNATHTHTHTHTHTREHDYLHMGSHTDIIVMSPLIIRCSKHALDNTDGSQLNAIDSQWD